MKVFKFGGASIKSAEAITNIRNIIKKYNNKLFIVISAMDKTTKAFEDVLYNFFANKDYVSKIEKIKSFHLSVISKLFADSFEIKNKIESIFNEIYNLLDNKKSQDYHKTYDALVSYGEILSTIIISEYLNYSGIKNKWLDARKIISTDSNFRKANVDFQKTAENLKNALNENENIYITQGFIAADSKNNTTTLGREGSDYSAAIFANILNAESLTLWKDVAGIYNADPKLIEQAQKIDQISYYEATELAYFGSKIIHPKTAKPLIDKNIKLFIKSFENPDLEGSSVANYNFKINPVIPIYIFNKNQTLITLRAKEFEFISEKIFEKIFKIFYDFRVKINLIQNSALTVSLCFDHSEVVFEKLLAELKKHFEIRHNQGLTLLTVRHFDENILKEMLQNKKIFLEQKNRLNAFYLY